MLKPTESKPAFDHAHPRQSLNPEAPVRDAIREWLDRTLGNPSTTH
jgi:hypothetical protein